VGAKIRGETRRKEGTGKEGMSGCREGREGERGSAERGGITEREERRHGQERERVRVQGLKVEG
jgi:hypothetical protein